MADPAAPKPTGRRVRGYISDLVELSGPRSLWTAVVFQDDYRTDPALEAGLDRASAFVAAPGVPGLLAVDRRAPGVYLYDTGEVRCARELIGAAPRGVGWRGAIELLVGAARALAAAHGAAGALPSHGSLDPHRVVVDYGGSVSVIGYGIPRLDLLDFLDDTSLVPPLEALRFTAPESLEGAAEDFTTDLFALALIAVELATGQPLYAGADARAVLALAADGDGRKLLRQRALPDGLEAVFGPLLEPWPDDRPRTADGPLAPLQALLPALPGSPLAQVMEGLAETASDVELDLPRGWVLPASAPRNAPPPAAPGAPDQVVGHVERAAAPPPDTKALRQACDRAIAACDVAQEAARQAEAAMAVALDTDDPAVRALLDEARHHVSAAADAAADADTALAAAERAADVTTATRRAEEAEDAADRARGACAEAERTMEAARAAARASRERAEREAHEAELARKRAEDAEADRRSRVARVVALSASLEAIRAAVESAEALAAADRGAHPGRDLGEAIQRSRAARDAALSARDAASGSSPGEAVVLRAEQEVARQLELARGALSDARAARVQADRERSEQEDRNRARARAAEELVTLTDRAASAADLARTGLAGLDDLTHAGTGPVADAIRAARRAATDAADAADALSRFELEPDDDPAAVLDAATTHLQSAEAARDRATAAAASARAADQAETLRQARLAETRKIACERHRQALQATGERVEVAVAAAETAFADARGQAGDLDDDDAVMGALADVGALAEGLAARRANWRAMAGPAADLDDPDELEALVHTGLAEAGFAETDVAELPPLLAALARALDAARDAREAARTARELASNRARAALIDAEREASAVAELAAEDPLQGAPPEALAEPAAQGHARSFAEAVRRCSEAMDRARRSADPDHLDADAAVEAARSAREASTLAREQHRALVEVVRVVRQRLQAEADARRAASEAAHQARQRIDAALADARVEARPPADDAVGSRVAAEWERLQRALAAVPADVSLDIDADPHAARDVLVPLAKQAIAAAREVRSTSSAWEKAVAQAAELVAALRVATRTAEAAADTAATAAAAARGLLAGLDGEWPGAADQQRELRELIGVVDEAAARASAESEATSDADHADVAQARAEAARAAAAVADEALGEARERARILAVTIQQARNLQVEADRAERDRAITAANARVGRMAADRDRLDAAVQRAATSLADTPSADARAAWDDAETAVDRATSAFERAHANQRAIAAAVTAADANARLRALLAEADGITSLVDEAARLAARAAETAEQDAAANAELSASLRNSLDQIEALAEPVGQALAHARALSASLDDGSGAEPLARLEEQGRHVAEAAEQARQVLGAAHNAPDTSARETLNRRMRGAVDRATAAANTAAALAKRVDQLEAARAERLEARRRKASEAASRVHRAAGKRVEIATNAARAAAERHAEFPELEAAVSRIDTARTALEGALAEVERAARDAETSKDAALAEDALDLVQSGTVGLDDHVRTLQAAIDRAEAERTSVERQRAEAAARARAEHTALIARADSDLNRARSLADAARNRLEQARPALAASPARSAATAWDEASAAVASALGAAERAALAHAGLASLDGPAARATADEVRAAADEVRDVAATVEPTLAAALRSAQALAGILDAATAVRARQADLHDRLASARGRLELASRGAAAPKTLAERARADRQLEELDQSMNEADTSLRELGEATSADEANALLEVAVASLDIAASVFDLAMPVVEHAIQVAEIEGEARKARAAALEAAAARIRAAGDAPDASETGRAFTELEDDGRLLPDDDGALADATRAARAAVNALVRSREALDLAVKVAVPDDPERAVALADAAERARDGVVTAHAEAAGALDRARVALEVVREAEAARRERIAHALEQRTGWLGEFATLQAQADVLRVEAEAFEADGPLPEADALREGLLELASIEPGPEPDPDDEGSVFEAALGAEAALERAREIGMADRFDALRAAARRVRDERAARAEALARARREVERAREELRARLAAHDDAVHRAERLAAERPEHAAEALAAMVAARSALVEPVLDHDRDDPEETAVGLRRIAAVLDAARAFDAEAAIHRVRQAVEAAELAERDRRARLDAARARIAAANTRLHARQQSGRAWLIDLSEAGELPEVESAWNELLDGLRTLDELRFEVPTDDRAVEAAADHAEAALLAAPNLDDLAENARSAVEEAHQSRAAARARIEAAHEMLDQRIAAVDAALAAEGLPDAPPVAAARIALTHAGERLRGARLPALPPEGTATAALRQVADRADAALALVIERDIAGLVRELDRAVAVARAAAQAEEAARVETQGAAIGTIDDAVAEIQEGVRLASAALDQAPRPDPSRATARAHRSASTDAIEAARAQIEELRALRRRLDGSIRSEVAIALAFDAESVADTAREALGESATRTSALIDEVRRLTAAMEASRADLAALTALSASVEATLAEVPPPVGAAAESAQDALDAAAQAVRDAQRAGERAAAVVGSASSAREAESAAQRVSALLGDARDAAESVRNHAASMRAATQDALAREEAVRAEAAAAARERTRLAAVRAARAVEDVVRALELASAEAGRHAGDAGVGERLTAIAQANDRALQAADDARRDASDTSGDPAARADRAAASADDAEACAAEALRALDAVRDRVRELGILEIAAAERVAAEQFDRRDAAVPRLTADLDGVRSELDRHLADAAQPGRDAAVEAARARVASAAEACGAALDRALESLGLLAGGRPEDVDDFLRECDQALADARRALGPVRLAASTLADERAAAQARQAELELEEHRGRAWEACRSLRAISGDLTRARAALGDLPESPSPALRAALDRLAEVERRLWRAGQRSDEARERAGSTQDLTVARESAELAEKALGSPGRWEREIDAALGGATQALRDEPPTLPEAERMRLLRRGKNLSGEVETRERLRKLRDQEIEATDFAQENPTEALLQRLRHGKSTGETGRERLRRLREQRREEELREQRGSGKIELLKPEALKPDTLEPVPMHLGAPPEDAATAKPGRAPPAPVDPNDYAGVEDFEDMQPTRIAKATPAPADPRRAELMDRLRSRSKAAPEDPGATRGKPDPKRKPGLFMPEDDGHTQIFSESKAQDREDDATQMFSREMLDDFVEDQGTMEDVDED